MVLNSVKPSATMYSLMTKFSNFPTNNVPCEYIGIQIIIYCQTLYGGES